MNIVNVGERGSIYAGESGPPVLGGIHATTSRSTVDPVASARRSWDLPLVTSAQSLPRQLQAEIKTVGSRYS